jgi:hypothetical protein
MNSDINWVRARSECSVAHKFQVLKSEIQSDIDERNKLEATLQPRFLFDMPNGHDVVIVTRSDQHRGVSVVFKLDGNAIIVFDDSRQEMFRVSVTLNDDGVCAFKIGEQECASWHVRKRALESLFF